MWRGTNDKTEFIFKVIMNQSDTFWNHEFCVLLMWTLITNSQFLMIALFGIILFTIVSYYRIYLLGTAVCFGKPLKLHSTLTQAGLQKKMYWFAIVILVLPCGGSCKNCTTVVPAVLLKRRQKKRSEGSGPDPSGLPRSSGKPLLCILSYEKTRLQEERRVMSPWTLPCLVLATHYYGDNSL